MLLSHGSAQRWLPLQATGVNLLRLDGPGPWTVGAGAHAITVSAVARPRGVHEWGRDLVGLYATTPSLGQLQMRFDLAADTPLDPEHPTVPMRQPEWLASPVHRGETMSWRFGVDLRAGVFAELSLGTLIQRFRWIPAGDFSMGSPADEPERYGDEGPCHRVRLTEDFWLADSACTQALWLAVMGDSNPVASAAMRNTRSSRSAGTMCKPLCNVCSPTCRPAARRCCRPKRCGNTPAAPAR